MKQYSTNFHRLKAAINPLHRVVIPPNYAFIEFIETESMGWELRYQVVKVLRAPVPPPLRTSRGSTGYAMRLPKSSIMDGSRWIYDHFPMSERFSGSVIANDGYGVTRGVLYGSGSSIYLPECDLNQIDFVQAAKRLTAYQVYHIFCVLNALSSEPLHVVPITVWQADPAAAFNFQKGILP